MSDFITKITTKQGDNGRTYSLLHLKKLEKSNDEFEYYGKVDELLGWIGILYYYASSYPDLQKELLKIIEAIHHTYELINNPKKNKLDSLIYLLEKRIYRVEKEEKLNDFVMEVFSNPISIYANMCRIKAREVERWAVKLKLQHLYKFWNRLSDYFFAVVVTYETNKKTYKDLQHKL